MKTVLTLSLCLSAAFVVNVRHGLIGKQGLRRLPGRPSARRFDAVCVGDELRKAHYDRMGARPDAFWETGYPQLDPLFRRAPAPADWRRWLHRASSSRSARLGARPSMPLAKSRLRRASASPGRRGAISERISTASAGKPSARSATARSFAASASSGRKAWARRNAAVAEAGWPAFSSSWPKRRQ